MDELTSALHELQEIKACAAYRNRWANAYRALVTEQPHREGRYEPVRVASAASWDSGERLTDDAIRTRVQELTE
jgi:hypothetical protein